MNLKVLAYILPAFLISFTSNVQALEASSAQKIGGLPDRSPSARTGTEFMAKLTNTPAALREKIIVEEVLNGNIPESQRQLVPIERTVLSGPYRGKTLRYWVLPDYLAIGSDSNFVRVPLNMSSIKVLAKKLNLSIPTTLMVDDIYQHAEVKLKPTTLPSGRQMSSAQYFQKHNSLVQTQLAQRSWKPGMLVAGHKKDVVQSMRLLIKPEAVAIYGWHRGDQRPIQPLSTVHGSEYADYSHGVRFVSNMAEVNGQVVDLRTVLNQKLAESMAQKLVSGKPRS